MCPLSDAEYTLFSGPLLSNHNGLSYPIVSPNIAPACPKHLRPNLNLLLSRIPQIPLPHFFIFSINWQLLVDDRWETFEDFEHCEIDVHSSYYGMWVLNPYNIYRTNKNTDMRPPEFFQIDIVD